MKKLNRRIITSAKMPIKCLGKIEEALKGGLSATNERTTDEVSHESGKPFGNTESYVNNNTLSQIKNKDY